MTAAAALPRRFASLVKIEHTVFALPFAYIGALLCVQQRPFCARSRLDHACDARCALPRDGAEPGDRRGDRRPQSAHGRSRAAGRTAFARAGHRLLRTGACALSRVVLPARSDRAVAVADPARRVRRLPVPEALHLAEPHLARCSSTGSRRSAPGLRSPAGCRGRRGPSARQSRSGSPASICSIRCSIASSTSSRACTPWRCASAWRACSGARACCTS